MIYNINDFAVIIFWRYFTSSIQELRVIDARQLFSEWPKVKKSCLIDGQS